MLKGRYILLFLLAPFVLPAQDAELPPDFRQHNLTAYNANLLNPVFSLDNSEGRSLALWTRWQWQTVDGDPTTLLFNYTHRLNVRSAGGLGFFQHNTGLFLQTGALVNYAYNFELGGGSELAFGVNAFGFQRKPADEIFQPNPDIPLPQFDVGNDFILQIAPSIRFRYNDFSAGITAENFIDYNFNTREKESEAADKIYLGHLSYRIPVFIFGTSEDSYIQPMIYLKSVPGTDDQFGLNGLFSTPKFWGQLGYNTFYGVSAGGGGRFFKNFSIGALVEFGSQNSFQGSDTSIEFVTAYNFGEGDIRRRVVGFDVEEEDAPIPQEEVAEVDAEEEEDAEAVAEAARKEQQAIAEANERREERQQSRRRRERDSLANAEREQQLAQQRMLDSLADARREEALAAARRLEEERRKDSLALVAEAERQAAAEIAAQEEVRVQPGEKLEQTTSEDGLIPGYYLIANVFGTKKYFDAFMKNLSTQGLQPKSFFRSKNSYNYVYLDRYDSVDAARAARDSKFNGRYNENLWIFRVMAN